MALLLATGCASEDHAVVGVEYFAAGKYTAAYSEYQHAVKGDPHDHASYNMLAIIAGNLNDPASALRYVDTALQINPRYSYAHLNRGTIKGEAGDSAACLASLTRAIELDSTLVEAYFNRGLYQAKYHNETQAIADLRQASRLAPNDYAAHYHLGRLLLQRGDQQQGCQHLTKALSITSIPEAQELQEQYCKLL